VTAFNRGGGSARRLSYALKYKGQVQAKKNHLAFKPELLGELLVINRKAYVVGGSSSSFTSKEACQWNRQLSIDELP
jgi:hypothetical protein